MFAKTSVALAIIVAITSGALAAPKLHSTNTAFDGTYVGTNADAGLRAKNDVNYSNSLGRQSFANPDRDFSIENLSSHAN
jgi:hypothetical protein